MTTEFLKREDGTYLNVEFIKGTSSKPGIVYLHGLLSSKNSKKGKYLLEDLTDLYLTSANSNGILSKASKVGKKYYF